MKRTQDDQKTQALREELMELELALQDHYCRVGKQLLETMASEQATADRLIDAIIKKRKKLAVLQGARRCARCLAVNDSDSDYCKRCGTRISPQHGARSPWNADPPTQPQSGTQPILFELQKGGTHHEP